MSKCPFCNEIHQPDPPYPDLDPDLFCPDLLRLNERLSEECLRDREYQPTDPSGESLLVAPRGTWELVGITSYRDYLLRKAYLGTKPLREDEKWKLDYLVKKVRDRSVESKKGAKNRLKKKKGYDDRQRLRRFDMRARWNHLQSAWKRYDHPVALTEDEFVNDVMSTFMVSSLYPWVGTVAEYIRLPEDGGVKGAITMFRNDLGLPLQLGNINLFEGNLAPKTSEARKKRDFIGLV